MTKARSKPKSKSRRLPRKAKVAPVVVQKVNLPPTGIVRVIAPPGLLPVVAIDPVKREVVIAPVKKKESWWESIFG